MIDFQYPELFLLAIPLWFAYRRWGRARGATGWLRLATIVILLIALTGPRLNLGGRGVDIIAVIDRSRSMPARSAKSVEELVQNVERNRSSGDRVGLVTFGSTAQMERLLANTGDFKEYTKEILPDGSDLNDALETALNLVDERRPARIVVFSDGESNGASPLSAARRAREAGVPIDFRAYERIRVGDVAVESIMLPESVAPREPFQYAVWIYADKSVQTTLRISRNGEDIEQRTGDIQSGMNRLVFNDLLGQGGFYNYTVKLEIADDPLPENNVAAGIVRVDAGPKILVLNNDGVDDEDTRLAGALAAANIPYDVDRAKEHPLTQDSLDQYRAVIVENVPAEELGRLKMERLAQFVEDLGGGLMLTGGKRSFGTGGYFRSPLDAVLPVSMEMREEDRKTRVALAIVLDRSGSMSMPVGGGKTKMDLANLGTAECVRLLSPMDKVSVIAVDSSPHVIQAMTTVNNKEQIAKKALSIESMGGGIFVYEALVAAGKELTKASDISTRHIILFSDAQDSEEPGAYKALLKKFEAGDITVSVIGLGTKSDVDAKLLEDIAKLGKGNIMFTTDPKELPRLFTQDTMSIARSTFVEKDPQTQPTGIPGRILPDIRGLGDVEPGAFPQVDGYNLSYLKPNASGGAITQDEYDAPLSAFWHRGLGRVAALTFEVDGKFSGQFANWNLQTDYLVTHARWLLGGDDPDEIFTKIERQGQDAVVTVELDPERPRQERMRAPELLVVPPGEERIEMQKPDLVWVGPNTLEARLPMHRTGTYRTLVKTGPREITRGPAVTLPYSPEYVPRIDLPTGREVLESVAEITGGLERTDIVEVLADPPRSAQRMSLLPILMVLGILLVLVEIAGRRLSLWERSGATKKQEDRESVSSRVASWLPQWKFRMPRRGKKQAAAPSPPQAAHAKRPATTDPSDAEPDRKAQDVFAAAKQRAKRRLK